MSESQMRAVITKACDHTGIGLPYCEVCDTAYGASLAAPAQPAPDPLRVAGWRLTPDGGYVPSMTIGDSAADSPARDPLRADPDHILVGLTCWCRPYPDHEDPEVIIHRLEVAG